MYFDVYVMEKEWEFRNRELEKEARHMWKTSAADEKAKPQSGGSGARREWKAGTRLFGGPMKELRKTGVMNRKS